MCREREEGVGGRGVCVKREGCVWSGESVWGEREVWVCVEKVGG